MSSSVGMMIIPNISGKIIQSCSSHHQPIVVLPNKKPHPPEASSAPGSPAAIRQLQRPAKELCCALAVRHRQLQVTQLPQPTAAFNWTEVGKGVQKWWSSPTKNGKWWSSPTKSGIENDGKPWALIRQMGDLNSQMGGVLPFMNWFNCQFGEILGMIWDLPYHKEVYGYLCRCNGIHPPMGLTNYLIGIHLKIWIAPGNA